jgi:pimeloyl-ACP methyl ester carboxylesterase
LFSRIYRPCYTPPGFFKSVSNAQHHENWLPDLQNGSYALISDADEVDTAVIFVHGFLGGAESTWLNFQEAICSQITDHWSKCDVYFFSYRSFGDDITESADDLLTFIQKIFPDPPESIFKIPKRVRELPFPLELELTKPSYKQLVLVGHSEGGIVIRRAVDLAYARKITNVLMARLALFAPAHKGVKLSGWIGACLSVGRVDAIFAPILNSSPAFVEMKQKGLLTEVENHTLAYQSESKGTEKGVPASLHAHIVFGREDHVVQKGFILGDCLHKSEKDKDHISICKPKTGYDRPLKFVLKRVEGEETCTDLDNS